MSRPRLLGYSVICVLALAVVAVSGAGTIAQGVKDSKPVTAEYTVAATSASAASGAEANAASAAGESAVVSRVVVNEGGLGQGPVPASVTLLLVGTMLIALAAAVRRTT